MPHKETREEKERWQNWLALSTAIMAVLAALTTLYMGKYSSRAIMSQGLESDQWAHYQAKSIKGHTFEISRQALELQYRSQKGLAAEVAADYETTLKKYADETKRYDSEKKRDQGQGRTDRQGKAYGSGYGGQLCLCPDLPADRHHALIPFQSNQKEIPLVHRTGCQPGLDLLFSGWLALVLLTDTKGWPKRPPFCPTRLIPSDTLPLARTVSPPAG